MNPTKSVQRQAAIAFLQAMVALHKSERQMHKASEAVRYACSSQDEFERLDDERDLALIEINQALAAFNKSRDNFVAATAYIRYGKSTDEADLIDQANDIINSTK